MVKIALDTGDITAIVEDKNAETLTDVIELFSGALKAVGYCWKGNLEIVEEE